MSTIKTQQDHQISTNCDVLMADLPEDYVRIAKLNKLGNQRLAQLVSGTSSDFQPLRIGLFGTDTSLILPLIIWLHQQCPMKNRLAISVYFPKLIATDVVSIGDITTQWHQLGLLDNKSPLKTICQSIIDSQVSMIDGIQPLTGIGAHHPLSLQFHIGTQAEILNNTLAQDSALFHHWIINNPAPIAENNSDLWQLARLSDNKAFIYQNMTEHIQENIRAKFASVGFTIRALPLTGASDELRISSSNAACDPVISQERRALRAQAAEHYGYSHGQLLLAGNKKQSENAPNNETNNIAIIGGGLASTALCLSLAHKGKNLHFFCKDEQLATRASGNKQGAIYPLLTPDNNTLSLFFQQAFLYSRRLIQYLEANGHKISHDFCGVLHTGHDERSQQRVNKIINGQNWPTSIATSVSAQKASEIASVDIDQSGIFYPLGGWVCPHEFAQAAFDHASQLTQITSHFNCSVSRISQKDGFWYLHSASPSQNQETTYGPFKQLVLANGEGINQFEQSNALQITGFRGQVSHIPARAKLSKLSTVLCALGYLTPHHQGLHCVGASYVKQAENLDYCPQEQLGNLQKMHQSYSGANWLDDIDISDHSARIGVRMVTRDHAPMMGLTPDIDSLKNLYHSTQNENSEINKAEVIGNGTSRRQQKNPLGTFWQHNSPPSFDGLYILGGLGSRGLSSGPLAAEALAAQICNEPSCIDYPTQALLNPNRMWLRKLIKGKAVEF